MSEQQQAIGLHQPSLPWTTAMLRLLFGMQPVQGKHGPMMPELVALDYVRMLMFDQKLPVLVLSGLPSWHKLFITWLQDVMGVRMIMRDADQTEQIRNTAEFHGVVVVNGEVTERLVMMLGLLNNHAYIDAGPPLETEQRRIIIRARYIVTTTGPMPLVAAGAPLCWFRTTPVKDPSPDLLAGLKAEKLLVMTMLARTPLNTTAESPMWFNPELLVDSEPEPDTKPTA